MKTARKPAVDPQPAAAPVEAAPRDFGRLWLLGAFVALVFGRPLVPSEGVAWLGDGQPFVLGLLLVALGCIAAAVVRGGFYRRFHWVDAAVAALVLLMVFSSTFGILSTMFGEVSGRSGRLCTPRSAINMLWEWVGLGLVYFLARQLVTKSLEARAVAALMVALAVVLAVFGLYQVSVVLPSDRAAYAADPDAVLRSIGQWFPAGSPERARFEDRLQSSEPLSTFALANSLAGFLLPWLLVGLAATWSIWRHGRSQSVLWLARMIGLAVCLAAVVVCLVLTKSRSAMVGLAVGLVVLPFVQEGLRRAQRIWIAVGGAAVLLAVAVAALASRGWDMEVLSEAGKSLSYRGQYWQATLSMIANNPWLGVGPSEFQDYYTQHKLPESSEEIRDPHNFLLEVWATGGSLSLLALLVALALFARRVWRSPAGEPDPPAVAPLGTTPEVAWFVVGGGVAGTLLAALVAPSFGFSLPGEQIAGILAMLAAVLVCVWPWIIEGTLTARMATLGVLVLAINLLAAGGIAFPAVAGSFWLLMALAVNQTESPAEVAQPGSLVLKHPVWRRLALGAGFAACAAAAVGCYQTAFLPVLLRRAAMARVEGPARSVDVVTKALLDANAADPYSPEPWIAMGELSLNCLKADPKSEEWDRRFASAATSVISLRKHSSAAWRQVGSWYRDLATVDDDPEVTKRVLQLTRGAMVLYPSSAILQAEYALALQVEGNEDTARRRAETALKLDRQTPHPDKKLPANIRKQMETLAAKKP